MSSCRCVSQFDENLVRHLEVLQLSTWAAPGRKATAPLPRKSRTREQLKHPASANRVLLLGRIHELALYRAEVLRDRGFEVRTSSDKTEALKLIRAADYDALVLSYTLSSKDVEDLVDEMREHCPHCPLVVIAKSRQRDRKISPDAIALANDGPKALVAALRRVLQRH